MTRRTLMALMTGMLAVAFVTPAAGGRAERSAPIALSIASPSPTPVASADVVVTPIDLPAGAGDPSGLDHAGDILFFWAGGERGPRRLWRTDGTARGTASLDICRSVLVCGVQRNLAFVREVARSLFFLTAEGAWRSDGTTAGTGMILRRTAWWHRVTGPFGHRSRCQLASSATHVFMVTSEDCDDPYPQLLVAIDVRAGTVRRLRLLDDAMASRLISAGPRVFVFAYGERGLRGWRTDGSVSGTRRVQGTLPSSIWSTALAPRRLYVVAGDAGDRGLWMLDTGGAVARSSVLRWPIGERGLPVAVTTLGDDALVLTVDPSTCDLAMWRSDGTRTGTVRIATLREGERTSDEEDCDEPWVDGTPSDDRTYLRIGGFEQGAQLWATDGTSAGTHLLYQASSEPSEWSESSEPTESEPVRHLGVMAAAPDGRLLFGATSDDGRAALWWTDGTPAGTEVVATFSAGPDELVVSGSTAYLTASDASGVARLWSAQLRPEAVDPSPTTSPGPSEPAAPAEVSPDPALVTLVPDGLSLDRQTVVTMTGPQWVARYDPRHPATGLALKRLRRFLARTGRTIDDLAIVGATYGRRGNTVATVTAIRVRGVQEPRLAEAVLPFVFAGLVTPDRKDLDVDGRRVIGLTDRDLGGNYRQYLYASGDVAWVIDADVDKLTEIIRALP